MVLSACVKQPVAHSLFRWRSLSAASDTLIVHLERGVIQVSPDSVFALTLDSLKHEIARSPAPSQLEARCCYWSAVLATRRHAEGDTVRRLTVRAIELCDSAAYPYDMARFRHLEALMLFRDNSFRQHEVFRDCYDYFAEQKDGFMTAWLALDLGKLYLDIGDLKRANLYYSLADSLLECNRIDDWHIKTSLNNANVLHLLGNNEAALAKLDSLLVNPVAQRDTSFYAEVLIDKYMISGDKSSLDAANALMRVNLPPSVRRTLDLAMANRFYSEGRIAEAVPHLDRLLSLPREGLPADELCDIFGIAARVYDAMGMADSANVYYRQIAVLQDSMLSRNESLNILNSEVREEIAKNDEKRENELKQERLRTWLVVLALLLVAGTALFYLYRRMQSHRLATLRTNLELERERRKVVSLALAMTEKDNVLEAVLSDISEMKKGGEIGEAQIRQLEQNVKMHLIGRQDWEDFKVLFEKVHPGFSSLLKATYPAVTEGDIRLSIYLKAGMNTKQIARMLQLQPDSVKKNRQRLRRHLGLTADQSLEDLLRSLG